MQLKRYANQHLRTIPFSLVSITLIATAFLCLQQLHAGGSELSARGGYRAHKYALNNARAGVPFVSNTMKALRAGDTLYVGYRGERPYAIGRHTQPARWPNFKQRCNSA